MENNFKNRTIQILLFVAILVCVYFLQEVNLEDSHTAHHEVIILLVGLLTYGVLGLFIWRVFLMQKGHMEREFANITAKLNQEKEEEEVNKEFEELLSNITAQVNGEYSEKYTLEYRDRLRMLNTSIIEKKVFIDYCKEVEKKALEKSENSIAMSEMDEEFERLLKQVKKERLDEEFEAAIQEMLIFEGRTLNSEEYANYLRNANSYSDEGKKSFISYVKELQDYTNREPLSDKI